MCGWCKPTIVLGITCLHYSVWPEWRGKVYVRYTCVLRGVYDILGVFVCVWPSLPGRPIDCVGCSVC